MNKNHSELLFIIKSVIYIFLVACLVIVFSAALTILVTPVGNVTVYVSNQ